MGVVISNIRYATGLVRSSLYRRLTHGRLCRQASPVTFEHGYDKFTGSRFVVTPELFRRMGLNPQLCDGKFSVIELSTAEYARFNRSRNSFSRGFYVPQPDMTKTIGTDLLRDIQYTHIANNAIIPENEPLATLFHETLHDIFARRLTKDQLEDFVLAAATAHERAVLSCGLNRLGHGSERALFGNVRRHADLAPGLVIRPAQLEQLIGERPDASLRKLLDEDNLRFFDEYFAMAGEVYFGYDGLLAGAVPKAVEQVFGRIGLKG